MATLNDLSDSIRILNEQYYGDLEIKIVEKNINLKKEPCLYIKRNIKDDMNDENFEDLSSIGWICDDILDGSYLPINCCGK